MMCQDNNNQGSSCWLVNHLTKNRKRGSGNRCLKYVQDNCPQWGTNGATKCVIFTFTPHLADQVTFDPIPFYYSMPQ